jgi:hypothetical protein
MKRQINNLKEISKKVVTESEEKVNLEAGIFCTKNVTSSVVQSYYCVSNINLSRTCSLEFKSPDCVTCLIRRIEKKKKH